MLENIYICRHGFRANWEEGNTDPGPTGTFNDPPLAQRGLLQAERLGVHLDTMEPRADALFSSPFYRCLQTITPLARMTGLPIHVEPGVGEWFAPQPPNTGLHARPILHKLQRHVAVPLAEYGATLFPSRLGESIPALRSRCEMFLSAWIARVEAEMPHVRTAVIMTHAPIVIGLGRVLTNSESRDIACPAASVSLYRRQAPLGVDEVTHGHGDDCWACHGTGVDIGEWVQIMNGNTDFLPDGAERAWTFRDIQFEPDGTIIDEPADGKPWIEADLFPVGLAEGMEKNVKRQVGKVNELV